ncbi:MAG: 3-oxoacyl-[acyl-carrier protein] reductase, partial [Gammaproteobacteria bacterium]
MFSDQIVLVTGASRGIGEAIARAFAEKNAIVIGTATSQSGADKITSAIQNCGSSGRGIVLDVANSDSVKTCLKTITEEYGSPDILIN